jgi:hypothetical protein
VTANIRVGARVQILQPDYVAGRTGIVISPEVLSEVATSERWIIQVEDETGEDILLSLHPDDFIVIN